MSPFELVNPPHVISFVKIRLASGGAERGRHAWVRQCCSPGFEHEANGPRGVGLPRWWPAGQYLLVCWG